MSYKIGDKVTVDHPNGEKFTGEVLELYETISTHGPVKMAEVRILDDGFVKHTINISEVLMKPLEYEHRDLSANVVTCIDVVATDLLRENERLMSENKRLSELLDVVTRQYKELSQDNAQLREELKALRLGVVN